MNYTDEILENKAFDWFKQLMYNIVVAVCIILAGCLVLVYGFGFTPYNVLTGSMEPAIYAGDLVVVKAQDSYSVGDVLTFYSSEVSESRVTHRIVAIVEDSNGVTYYMCHGDAVGDVDGVDDHVGEWEDDAEYLAGMTYDEIMALKKSGQAEIQDVTADQIIGKVVATISNWGTYSEFIANHKWLFVAMVVAIWGISATFQNENEIKRTQRMFN